METTKTIPKNKIKNKKRSTNRKQKWHLKKTKKNKSTKKNQKNIYKNKNRLLFFWGGAQSFSIFSCYALAALQPPTIATITQDILHHKTTT